MIRLFSFTLPVLASLLLFSCGGSSSRHPDLDAPENLQRLALTFLLSNGQEMLLDSGMGGGQLQWADLTFNGSFEYHRSGWGYEDENRDRATLNYVSLTASRSFRLRMDLTFYEVDYSGLEVSWVSGAIGNWSYEYKETSLGKEKVIASGAGSGGSFSGSDQGQ